MKGPEHHSRRPEQRSRGAFKCSDREEHSSVLIGTALEALNLQAWSKTSAALQLEKRHSPLVGVCD